ncbi:MAG: DUF3788 domain-containing protein [Oscillospiraceae bacterium]|nr:DUF3788 domain-containing protein [Oscillospiraceae bacterium]
MDRVIKPYEEVQAMLGNASSAWEKLVGHIRFYYVMDEVWDAGKPTHKYYNSLYVRRGGKTLITLALREGYFIACVVLGKDERAKFDEQRTSFGETICKVYDETLTYHDGKWLGFDVSDESLVDDIIRLLPLKRKPNRKILPEERLEPCGRLDLGLSHEDITKQLIP